MNNIPMNEFEKLVQELSIKATFELVNPSNDIDSFSHNVANTYLEVHNIINSDLLRHKNELF